MNNCLICNAVSEKIFTEILLDKYNVGYHKCTDCGFIQTDKPYWLDEAYSDAITFTDIGLVQRNLNMANLLELVIKKSFNINGQFLDYAAGYGLLVRLMRDRGFDYYWSDKYCTNLFAKEFTSEDRKSEDKYEFVTAIEFFEHLVDPISEVENLFKLSDTIVFSTELVPEKGVLQAGDWWYISPEIGQHISFYTEKSFQVLAKRFLCNYYTNGKDAHILTKRTLNLNPLIFKINLWDKFINKIIRLISKTKNDNKLTYQLPSKINSDVLYLKTLKRNKII